MCWDPALVEFTGLQNLCVHSHPLIGRLHTQLTGPSAHLYSSFKFWHWVQNPRFAFACQVLTTEPHPGFAICYYLNFFF